MKKLVLLCLMLASFAMIVAGCGGSDTAKKDAQAFQALLEAKGIPATIRRELGDDIDGACGQLRLTNRRK